MRLVENPRQTKITLFLLFLVSAVFLSYAPVLNNGFIIWDDDVFLTWNQSLRGFDFKSVKEIFTKTICKVYVPLSVFSFAIERHFFGLDPFVYHLNNLVLHIFVTVLVFLFALRLGLKEKGALLAALIFGLHPIHVEAVAWVTSRKDVLYAFFYMLSLLSYCTYLKSQLKKKKYLFFTAALGFLSVLAKPMALSLPVILLILDLFFRRRIDAASIKEKAWLVLLFLPMGWMSYKGNMRIPSFSFPWAPLNWMWTSIFYIKKFFYPDFFVLLHELPDARIFFDSKYLFALVVFVMLIMGFVRFRKNRYFVFAILFYYASMFFLFRFDFTQDLNAVADRFMYLPCLGFCLGIGYVFETALQKVKEKRIWEFALMALVSVFLLILSLKTYEQTRVWKDGVSLWAHQFQKQLDANPAFVYTKLAHALVREDDFQKIINKHKEHQFLSSRQIGQVQKMIHYYKTAIKINPDLANAYFYLGNLYEDLGNLREAEICYRKATEKEPEHFAAYYGLGHIFQMRGDYKGAIARYRKALLTGSDNRLLYERVIRMLDLAAADNPSLAFIANERTNIIEVYKEFFGDEPTLPVSNFKELLY